MDPETTPAGRQALEQALYEVKRTIVGQDVLLERMLVALLARGHLLVEGVPGLAKTMAIKTLAQVIGGEFQRIQFTPDLVPADLVGTRIYNQRDGEFQVSLGPVFANLVLADEINRAPAKVQSALLEVMQERQVTIGRETYAAPDPFLVMATQNPIESEGVYALPEAQVDRFMLKVLIGYPSAAEEFVVVERQIAAAVATARVLDADLLRDFQHQTDAVYADPAVIEYAVALAMATRSPASVGRPDIARFLTYGASPRASINLVLSARALAFLRGRDHVLPTDVRDLARDVLRHRIVLSYEALAEDLSPDDVLTPILDAVPVPSVPLARACHARRPRQVRVAGSAGLTAYPLGGGSGGPGGAGVGLRPERLLRQLEWRVIRRLDGLLQGSYRSLFRGSGLDFTDLREYVPGDDPRHIEWNVTARLDEPWVREYVEDRELTALARARPLGVHGVRARRPAEAPRARRGRDDAGARADPRRQPRGCRAARPRSRERHPARIRAHPGAAHRRRAPREARRGRGGSSRPTRELVEARGVVHAGAPRGAGPRIRMPSPTSVRRSTTSAGWLAGGRSWSSSATSSPSPAGRRPLGRLTAATRRRRTAGHRPARGRAARCRLDLGRGRRDG